MSTKGEPDSVTKQYDSDGKLQSERHYGPDGNAIKDIDYTTHGNPKTHPDVPHEHKWDWTNPNKPGRIP